MRKKSDPSITSQFTSLLKLLDEDLNKLSNDDLLKDAAEEYGNVDAMIDQFNSIFNSAHNRVKATRLMQAKKGYEETLQAEARARSSNNVFSWPFEKKKNLLAEIHKRNSSLTLAARNDGDSEADIDSILEDLIELSAIDEKGNIE
jgi:hypothetical protein